MNRDQTPSDTTVPQLITIPNQSVHSAKTPGIQDGNLACKAHSFPFSSYLLQVGSPLILTIFYRRTLDSSFHLGSRFLPCGEVQGPERHTRSPNTTKHKVHIYSVICLCMLQREHEAKSSRDGHQYLLLINQLSAQANARNIATARRAVFFLNCLKSGLNPSPV